MNILISLAYSKIKNSLNEEIKEKKTLEENSLLIEEKKIQKKTLENSLNDENKKKIYFEINQLIIKNNDLKNFLKEKSPLKFYAEYIGPKINYDYVIFYGEVYGENSNKTENIIVFLKRDESIFNFYFYFILIFF
jgi:hypothetical protein